ncbi:hypothetical protein [Terriglobus sp.]|uniref:hypothetical protein n=1 Tax=Terriglobus sp. TaxID=1889013 RepID=UPI003B00C0AD
MNTSNLLAVQGNAISTGARALFARAEWRNLHLQAATASPKCLKNGKQEAR